MHALSPAGLSALHRAAIWGQLDAVKLLLARGASHRGPPEIIGAAVAIAG